MNGGEELLDVNSAWRLSLVRISRLNICYSCIVCLSERTHRRIVSTWRRLERLIRLDQFSDSLGQPHGHRKPRIARRPSTQKIYGSRFSHRNIILLCFVSFLGQLFSKPELGSNLRTRAFSLMVRISVSLNPSVFTAWMSMVISRRAPAPARRSMISRVMFPMSRE